MKTFAVLIAVLLSFSAVAVAQSAQPISGNERTGVIDINVTIASERVNATRSQRLFVLRLWQKNASRTPIGQAYANCVRIGRNDDDKVAWECSITFKMPLGQLVTFGVTTNFLNTMTGAVVGGTRTYIGTGGEMYGYRIGPGTYRVIMRLV